MEPRPFDRPKTEATTVTCSKRGNSISDAEGQEILEKFLAGDERAFDHIIKAYSPMMFGVLLRWFKLTLEDAQDLHQEVLLQLIVKAEGIRNLRPWLLGTTINQAKKRIRKLVRDRKLSDNFVRNLELMAPVDDRETRDLVERGLARASAGDRQLLHLIFFEGLSYREAAGRLGRPIGSIGPLRGRALGRFAGIIGELEVPICCEAAIH